MDRFAIQDNGTFVLKVNGIIGANLDIPKAVLPRAALGRILGDWSVCEPVGIGDIAALINLLNNGRLKSK